MTIHPGRLAPLSRSVLIAAFAVGGIWTAFSLAGIRVNASSSLPIGLYRITSDPAARLVEFCPAEPYASLSKDRGYRAKGNCPDGAEPLMKPLVAVAGDMVEMSSHGVAVNGRLLPNSAARSLDTRGYRLFHWPYGKHRVLSGAVWVISSFNQRSFDSRYFGPVPLSSVRSHLRPLITE